MQGKYGNFKINFQVNFNLLDDNKVTDVIADITEDSCKNTTEVLREKRS